MIHFDADNCTQIGTETELNIHAGTVRDVSFVSRPAGLPVLVSGGAGMPHVVCVCLCVCECVCVCVLGGRTINVFAARLTILYKGKMQKRRLKQQQQQQQIFYFPTSLNTIFTVIRYYEIIRGISTLK